MQEEICWEHFWKYYLLSLDVISDVVLGTVVAMRGDSLRTKPTLGNGRTWVLVLWLSPELAHPRTVLTGTSCYVKQ